MSNITTRGLRAAGWAVAAIGILATTGCASFYVDPALPNVQAADIRKPASPKPVQLLFTFQTKGAPNTRATDFFKTQVTDLVKGSGMFSTVGDQPDSRVLSITLNNIPLTDDAAAKGFMTGFTFGLVGATVTDGYVCTIDYLNGSDGARIQHEVKHAIHTGIGAGSAPPNLKPAAGIEDAVRTMTQQAINNALQKLANDPRFQNAP